MPPMLMALVPSASVGSEAEVAETALRWSRRSLVLNIIGAGHGHWIVADTLAEFIRGAKDPKVQATLREVDRNVSRALLVGIPGLLMWLAAGVACVVLTYRVLL